MHREWEHDVRKRRRSLRCRRSGGGNFVIRNSTIAGNTARSAGGLYLFNPSGTIEIANSTIVGNVATQGPGGGINGFAPVSTPIRIDQSTITGNQAQVIGGGVNVLGDVALTGTIVSGNTSGGGADLASYGYAATWTSVGSLFGQVSQTITLSGSGNLLGVDPMLDPAGPAMHGGATPTIALLAGSPAIGAGPNPVATFPGNGYDQRGPGYARVVGGQVDIGAFEFGATPPPTTTTTSTTSTTTSTTAETVASGGDPVVPVFTG